MFGSQFANTLFTDLEFLTFVFSNWIGGQRAQKEKRNHFNENYVKLKRNQIDKKIREIKWD